MFGIKIKFSKFNKLVYSYQIIFLSSLVLIPIFISVSYGKYEWAIYQILLYSSLALGLNLKFQKNSDNLLITLPKNENKILKIFFYLLIVFSFIQICQSLFYFYFNVLFFVWYLLIEFMILFLCLNISSLFGKIVCVKDVS